MTRIPNFPDYVSITPEAGPLVQEISRPFPPYSDFSPANLLSWDISGRGQLSLLHDNLVVQLPGYLDGETFITFLGNNRAEATAQTLLEVADKISGDRVLRLVPEVGAQALVHSATLHLVEDTANHDYVLSLPNVVEAHGKAFTHVRRSVNIFRRRSRTHLFWRYQRRARFW